MKHQRKNRRRSARGDKRSRVDSSCRNHGSCAWCRGNRTARNRRRQPVGAEW